MKIKTWAEATKALQEFAHGTPIAAALKTSDQKLYLSLGEDKVFAIGSRFKLYVLGALANSVANKEHTRNEKLALRSEWKSLPSGKMQDLPDGSTYSLLDFASNMISISDNTAADHSVNFLGRTKVEAMLTMMGNPQRYRWEARYFDFAVERRSKTDRYERLFDAETKSHRLA